MKFIRFLVVCLIYIAALLPVSSQVVVVPSTTRVTIDGRLFYLHPVQPGETLYSISRAYNVLPEDIETHNPGALEGIRAGSELRIPIQEVTQAQTGNVQEQDQFIRHITERGQTVFWIMQNYGITQEELFRHNPELASSTLQIGQVVRIPQISAIQTSDSTIAPQIFVVADCEYTSKTEFRIAMLLPLFIDDSLPATPPAPNLTRDASGGYRDRDGRYWINPRSTNAIEFYQGALLAIDSMKMQGLNAQILVYDTMREPDRVTQLLNNPEIKNADLIIGPFTTDMVDRVTDFARENQINYVTPTAISAVSMNNNPYLIQVNSGEINTISHIVNNIANQQNIHITLINNNSEPDQTLFNAYHNRLQATFGDSILSVVQMNLNSIQMPNRYLRRDRMNVVIVPSSNEAFVNIVTGHLNTASNSFQINVYGLESWTKFVNLDLEYLHALEFRFATAFYIDYDNQEVRNFLRKYRTMYGTEPTMLTGLGTISPNPYQLAFLGYDVTLFFLTALKMYGENLGNCLSNFRMNTLQSNFHFERADPSGGFRNTYFKVYKYNKDYTISKETVEN